MSIFLGSTPQCSAKPAAALAEHAQTVRVVDHQPGTVALLDLHQPGEVGHVAFGGVEALDDDQAILVVAAVLAQDLLALIEIVVAEAAARGAGQLHADDGAVVHELVVHDEIASLMMVPMVETLAACPLTNSRASSVPQNSAISCSERAMQRDLAGDHAARRDARAEAIERCLRRLGDGGMLVQSQVVAPGEVDVRLALDDRLGAVAALVGPEERARDGQHLADLLDLLDVAVGRQVGQARRLVAPVQAWSRGTPFLDGRRHTLTPSLTHQTLLPLRTRQPPPTRGATPNSEARPQRQRPRGIAIRGLAPRSEASPGLGRPGAHIECNESPAPVRRPAKGDRARPTRNLPASPAKKVPSASQTNI